MSNLVLVCRFHHRLVHLHGWRVSLGKKPGMVHWFGPGNRLYEPGRGVPLAA